MRQTEEIGFTAVLVVVFAMFVILGWGYAKRPRIVPLTLSIPGLALSGLHLGSLITKSRRAKEKEVLELETEPQAGAPTGQRAFLSAETKKILSVWIWIIGLAVAINFLGFMIALPVFLLTFIKFFAKRTWKLSALIAGCFTLAVYLVFYVGLKTTL